MRRACKRLTLMLLPAFIALVTACAQPYDSARFKRDFANGVAAYDAGDYAQAAAYWQPLAARFDLAAMRNMGHLYRQGLGVDKDLKKALAYFEAAARRGLAAAQYDAAMLYLSNDTIAYDAQKALGWLAQAAKSGYPPAKAQIKRLQMKSAPF